MRRGFTLVELLVVMAIIGVLAALGVGNYVSTQAKARDSQRKQDLRQLSNALELYLGDYGRYPFDSGGRIAGCPSTTSTPCSWGSGTFTDGNTVYMKTVTADPSSSYFYVYEVSSDGQKFRIFVYLENSQDPDIVATLTTDCGAQLCNFGTASPNTNLTDSF